MFLRLEVLNRTFGLELIESVLTNHHSLFRNVAFSRLLINLPGPKFDRFTPQPCLFIAGEIVGGAVGFCSSCPSHAPHQHSHQILQRPLGDCDLGF